MSNPQKWDWAASNGNATAEETATAYTALSTGGKTRDFIAAVWNDIIAKISEQRISWRGKEWDASILSLDGTKLSAGDNMTAAKFNSAILNIWPIETWPWAETLGRTEVKKGDRCYGVYFLHLTDGLNYWIENIEPIFFGWKLQGNVDITPAVTLYAVLPVKIDFTGFLNTQCNAGVYPALIVEMQLDAVDKTRVSVSVHDACIADMRLDIHSCFNVDVKQYDAVMIRIINFIRSAISGNVCVDRAIPFGFINSAICSMKGTVLTGNLAYTAVNLAFLSSLKAYMKTPNTLYFNADLQSVLDGSCALITLPCKRFAVDLGGIFNATASLYPLQALHTGIILQGLCKSAIRAYECWALYMSRTELHGETNFRVYAITAYASYLAVHLRGQLSVNISSLLAKIAYLSGGIINASETTLTAVVCQTLFTSVQLVTQADIQTTVMNGHPTYTGVNLQSDAETTAGIVLMPVAAVKANLLVSASISVNARFANKELVLASEIDDILVSTLDEQTVDSVETKFT